ncbi:MAG TPA: neutral zinc metallopeptidase [Blastocatellia bacterium]|nr:neutral zinc metallopeptidase [Blastocatellia bacterium]
MRWLGQRQSENVVDRRGLSRGGIAAGGGCATLIVILIALFFGVDPSLLLQQSEPPPGGGPGASRSVNPAEEESKRFVANILGTTEDVWNELFRQQLGKDYREPRLVLFSDATRSGCGFASAATGPFYCSADEQVYLDLQFFQEMQNRFRAAGDFAQAYVIAHEVGHHIQHQLGILNEVHSRRQRVSEAESNRLSVRTELQADFLAGVWGHHVQKMRDVVVLEPGDLEEALRAANAIGDDRLQKQAQGYVVPDSFTHGTAEQRARWFRRGFETGDLSQMMDTFKVSYAEL